MQDQILSEKRAFVIYSVLRTLVIVCFSMTAGVMWGFIEFFVEWGSFLDMQKYFVVQKFGSVTLGPAGSQRGKFTSRFLICRRGKEPLAEEMRHGDGSCDSFPVSHVQDTCKREGSGDARE